MKPPTPGTDGEPPGWQHSELFGKRSLIGAIALLAAVAVFFVGLPFIDGQTDYATAGPDGRYSLDEFASIQIADGWGIDSQSDLLTIIAKGGASAVLTPSIELDTSTSEFAQQIVDGLNDSGTWVVEPIQAFTTDGGVQGSSYIAHGADQVTASWVVADAGRLLVFNGLASESAFEQGFTDLEQMAKSILFESTTGAGE